jgi:hypothetical protein
VSHSYHIPFDAVARLVPVVSVCLLVVLVAGGWAAPPARARAAGAADAVVVAPAAYDRADPLIAGVEASGARVALVLLPRTVVARVDAQSAGRLRADGCVVLRAGTPPPPGASPEVERALRVIVALRAQAAARPPASRGSGVAATDGASTPSDVLHPEAIVPDLVSPSPALVGPRFLPDATEPTAFAAGSVAVAVIFPESDGSVDTSSEDWANADPAHSGDRRQLVVDRVLVALAWWEAREPAAGLHFVLPAAGSLGTPQTVSSGYEPVRHAAVKDRLWRHEIMDDLGFHGGPADDPPPEIAFDEAVRDVVSTDWALTVYAVDTLNDADGRFRDFMFAYSFALYGPYIVLTYDCGPYGFDSFDPVLAHEMGHAFGALDEYAAGPSYPSTGDLYSGYLWVQNRNAVNGGTTDHPCLMRGGDEAIDAYHLADPLCSSTRGQVGWRDTNGNTVPDVIDTAPTLTDRAQAGSGSQVTVGGVVHENPWPHGHNAQGEAFHHDLSIFVPHDVTYRVDGGPSLPVQPVDGVFDRPYENWTLTTAPLSDGHHLLEVSATTGSTATLTRDIWAGPTVVTLDLTAAAARITVGKKVALRLACGNGGLPIPYLSPIRVGPLAGGGRQATVDAQGVWRDSFSPRTTTTYVASFPGGNQFFAADSQHVKVEVRPKISAWPSTRSLRRRHTLRVGGHFTPGRSDVPLALEASRDGGATWQALVSTRTAVGGDFVLRYRPLRRGILRLRVRFAGDAKNLSRTKLLPLVAVR